MKWLFRLMVLIVVLLVPTSSMAISYLGFGIALDGFFPYDPEMYGERMVDNSWGKDMYGKNWSEGEDRVQFVGPNRYNMIWSPAFTQKLAWDFGLSVELTERIQYLHFAPNEEVDITFDRFMFPFQLTPKFTFNQNGKWRPWVGAGASLYYTVTRIAGKDLYDKWRNPDYEEDDTDDADSGQDEDEERRTQDSDEKQYFSKQHEFGISGWYPGFHGTIGTDIGISESLSLSLAFRYEVIMIESIDVEFISDGPNEWHWKKKTLKGDAGGFGASIGLMYSF